MEERQDQKKQSLLIRLQSISREQAILSGCAFAAAGLADVITHLDKNMIVIGGLAALGFARHSGDIIEHVLPKSARHVSDMTECFVESVAPMPEKHEDQSVEAKIKRLLGLGTISSLPSMLSLSNTTQEKLLDTQEEDDEPLSPTQGFLESLQRKNKGNTKPVFPLYPDDETLKLGEVATNGARFDPHINQLFGQGMIASAVQGSGKSMLNGVIIEQAGKCGVPVVVFDHKGEYAPITELPFINGLRAGSERLCAKIGPTCFELNEQNAAEFVQRVMNPDENGYRQAVIHLPSYGDSWLERASIVAAVGQALMARAVWLREQGISPIPCLVLMDEAQLYLPQNVELLPPEAREDKEVLNNLSNAYFSLVSNGRSNGYTVLFATPSLTYIAKWAIKSCQIRVLMRHTEKNDLDMCEKIVGRVATREEMEMLAKGTGVVFGFTDKPMIVHFDKKQSKDESETPGLDRLRKRQKPKQQQLIIEELPQETEPIPAMPSSKTTLNLDTILALAGKVSDETLLKLIDKLPDVDQREQESVIMTVDEPDLPKPQEPTLLERGLKAYEEGFTTIDDLAARLAITQWEARTLRSQIKVALKQEQEN